ncbi:uncharacterized protein DS421_9g276800 [Arachis hypogaea]|nr:uncharacterized protein DS421_9g276800 [Arachis hypogaea]
MSNQVSYGLPAGSFRSIGSWVSGTYDGTSAGCGLYSGGSDGPPRIRLWY